MSPTCCSPARSRANGRSACGCRSVRRGRGIIRQLLTESLLLALAAAVAAFFISRVVLEVVIYSSLTSLPPDIGNITLASPPPDWRVVRVLDRGRRDGHGVLWIDAGAAGDADGAGADDPRRDHEGRQTWTGT